MDIAALAKDLIVFLAPFLPYLLRVGERAAEEAGKKIGGEAWERAKALWDRLGRKERVRKAAEAAAALPDNPAVQQGMEVEVARALQEDEALRREVAQVWEAAKAAGVVVSAVGDRSVAIGGNVSGSVIITGDQNIAER